MSYKELITKAKYSDAEQIGPNLSEEYNKLCEEKINKEITEINKEYSYAFKNAENVRCY